MKKGTGLGVTSPIWQEITKDAFFALGSHLPLWGEV